MNNNLYSMLPNEEKRGKLEKEAKSRTLTYITAALGLVAGLAWNEAITALIQEIFPVGANTIIAKFLYAILLTVAVVVITSYLTRFLGKRGE